MSATITIPHGVTAVTVTMAPSYTTATTTTGNVLWSSTSGGTATGWPLLTGGVSPAQANAIAASYSVPSLAYPYKLDSQKGKAAMLQALAKRWKDATDQYNKAAFGPPKGTRGVPMKQAYASLYSYINQGISSTQNAAHQLAMQNALNQMQYGNAQKQAQQAVQNLLHHQTQALQNLTYFGTATAPSTALSYQQWATQQAQQAVVCPSPPTPPPTRSAHGKMEVCTGDYLDLALPDGGKLSVDSNGSYKLTDDQAKITYAANRNRAFNKFLNASDVIEEFVAYAADKVGARMTKAEMLAVPLELLIAFMVIRAAEADGEDPPEEEIARLENGVLRLAPPQYAMAAE